MNDTNIRFINNGNLTVSASADSPRSDKLKEDKRRHKKSLIKFGSISVLLFVMMIFSTVSWFTMNTEVESDEMSVETVSSPFELKTTGSAGLYDSLLDETIPGYGDQASTASSSCVKWRLSSDSQIKNLYSGSSPLTETEYNKITRLDSEEYGLKPGDSGVLKFSVIPNMTGISISFKLDIKGYKATFDSLNNKTNAPLVLVTDTEMNNYMLSHILFFYKGSDNKKHLLISKEFGMENISSETSGEIYWVWVPTLQEILDADIEEINDEDASKEVRRYFFENPEKFLKSVSTVSYADFTVEKQVDISAEEAEIESNISLVSGRNYNTYGTMYNDADQAIGDRINYISVELTADKTED